MKEADWLKAKKGEEMLALLAPHLSRRQWTLLACLFVRRLGKLLAEPRLVQAICRAEQHAGAIGPPPDASARLANVAAIADAIRDAAVQSATEQQRIVAPADADAGPDAFQHVEGRTTNPSAPLFQAAAERAQMAVDAAGEAAAMAGAAVGLLLEGVGDATQLGAVRQVVIEATERQAIGSVHVNLALKLKSLGDEAADRDNGRDVAKRYSAALATVEREVEYAGYRENDVAGQRSRADQKALGPFLLELCGNVCRPAVLDPAWRTADVIALAQSVESERTPERMLILRDALLDAGCDNRAILRHCRGMSEDEDQPLAVPHGAGCWVIDAILDREGPYHAKLPLGIAKGTRIKKK